MSSLLAELTEIAVMVIDGMALAIICFATLEAFVGGLRVTLAKSAESSEGQRIWRRYGRWLVVGLTFLLAADIIESSVAPTWDEIGKLGAIAVIRTFLNFFLERDIRESSADESPAAAR